MYPQDPFYVLFATLMQPAQLKYNLGTNSMFLFMYAKIQSFKLRFRLFIKPLSMDMLV